MQYERMGPGHQKPKSLPWLEDCAYMSGIELKVFRCILNIIGTVTSTDNEKFIIKIKE